jgi:hypothetical protein
MMNDTRLFRRSDPDFPTTKAAQIALVNMGRVEGEGPLAPKGAAGRCRFCGRGLGGDANADRSIPACGSCKTRAAATQARSPAPARAFTDAEKSLIRKVHGYLPRVQLLALLNERLQADLGPTAAPYTTEQLHTEIAAAPGTKPAGEQSWAALRKLLAQAGRDGTLAKIDEQVVRDFAIVFSLTPKHLMRLQDILLQPAED